MSDQDSTIFNTADQAQETTSTTNDQGSTPSIQLPEEIKSFVGEDKKYKSVEDLFKSIPHAQAHIEKLEEENRLLREANLEAMNAESVYNKLQDSADPQGELPTSATIDEQRIRDIIKAEDAGKVKASNLSQVEKKMKEIYGEKAQEALIEKSKALGISTSRLAEIAQESPNAFFNMVGLTGQGLVTPSSQSSINTSSLSGSTTEERNFKYWQGVRKSNPALYKREYSKMMEDAARLGDKFYKS